MQNVTKLIIIIGGIVHNQCELLHKLTEVFRGIDHVVPRCVVTDIDECVDNNGNCSKDANCTNSDGSFNCTCHDGYSGDGFNCSGNE